jgi:hypothetical protein
MLCEADWEGDLTFSETFMVGWGKKEIHWGEQFCLIRFFGKGLHGRRPELKIVCESIEVEEEWGLWERPRRDPGG